ncbi:MAG: hypothetical protein O3B15_07250 [Actinomycetota bacterium]|nr:hypothetical protein [Actinomycetota bacterium]
MSKRSTGHISQRELQAILNRAGRDPVRNHLFELRQGKFLTRKSWRKNLADADIYHPGAVLKKDHLEAWQQLSRNLFDENGLCNTLLNRPAFGTGYLNQNGMLVLGALLNSERALKVREIHEYLSFFISDEGTVRGRLIEAEKHGLVLKKHGPVLKKGATWTTAADFWERLEDYELLCGPTSRQERLAHRSSIEREEYAIHLRHGKITKNEQDGLRAMGCIRCGKTNEQHLAETKKNLQMEHFPPQRWLKKWGYQDHIDFNWAICATCNNNYSTYIKRQPVPPLNKFIRTSFRADADIPRAVLASLQTAIQKFYRHIDAKRYGEATKISLRAFQLWASTIPQNINPDDARAVHMFVTPMTLTPQPTDSRRLTRRVRRAGTPESAKSTSKKYANTERTKGSKRR